MKKGQPSLRIIQFKIISFPIEVFYNICYHYEQYFLESSLVDFSNKFKIKLVDESVAFNLRYLIKTVQYPRSIIRTYITNWPNWPGIQLLKYFATLDLIKLFHRLLLGPYV